MYLWRRVDSLMNRWLVITGQRGIESWGIEKVWKRKRLKVIFVSRLYVISQKSWVRLSKAVNRFGPNVPFLYPLKTSGNLTVFWCFQGEEKRRYSKFWNCQLISHFKNYLFHFCLQTLQNDSWLFVTPEPRCVRPFLD